jgi:hypothetical protein
MNRFSRLRLSQAVVVAVITALAVAALATLGATVSPAGTRTPAVEAAYPKKITICHRTKSKKNPYRTIRISRRALKAHLRHGDGIGPCPRAIFTMCHKTKTGKKLTIKVRGARAHQKHLKRGDKIGACKQKKKRKSKR